MPYRLGLDEHVASGVRRVASEQLGSAIRRLEDAGHGDRVEAVHDARKSVKKARALLRLVRPGLDSAAYRAELTALRDAGRLLSGTRNADVMLATIDALAARFAGHLPAATFEDLRHGAAARLGDRDGDDPIPRAVAALRAIAARVEEWPLERCDWADVRAGAKRSYARGRNRWKEARSSGDAEPLHEWRKRVKDLWYHQRLLRELWPGVLKAYADEADRLGDLLGDDHDLAVLAAFLEADEGELHTLADLAEIRGLIEQRRGELQVEARALGRRLYADTPKAFDRRLAACVRATLSRRPAAAAA